MVDGVERGHDGQQCLGGADVGRGLLAADVLLAGLQGQAVGGDAGVVFGDTHEAAGHGALQPLLHGHVGGVRAAEEQRHAEALGGADGDIRTLLARRGDQGQGQEVRGHSDQRAAFLGVGDHRGVVQHAAGDARLLQDDAVDDALGQALREVRDLDLEAEGFRAALDDRDGLREAVGVEDGLAVVRRLVLVGAAHHQHGLGDGGGFVQQRCVGDRQADEVLDHGLEVQQGFEPALGDFRLVRRVRGVPGRGFEDVAADHRRGERVVVALPDHLHGGLVLRCQLAQLGEDFHLAEGGGEREIGVLTDVLRNGGVHQGVDGVVADSLQHGVDVGLAARADVPVNEGRGGWGNSHKELHNSGGAGYATLIRVPPRSVLDLRVSAKPAFQGLRLHRR